MESESEKPNTKYPPFFTGRVYVRSLLLLSSLLELNLHCAPAIHPSIHRYTGIEWSLLSILFPCYLSCLVLSLRSGPVRSGSSYLSRLLLLLLLLSRFLLPSISFLFVVFRTALPRIVIVIVILGASASVPFPFLLRGKHAYTSAWTRDGMGLEREHEHEYEHEYDGLGTGHWASLANG